MICVVLIFDYGWLKHSEELEHFLSLAKNDYLIQTLRRKPLSLEKGERIYNFWKINFQISVKKPKTLLISLLRRLKPRGIKLHAHRKKKTVICIRIISDSMAQKFHLVHL